MTRKLIRTGNSQALTLSPDMKRHIGLAGNEVDVAFVEGGILITANGSQIKQSNRPRTIEEAYARTEKRFGNALRNLAK